MQHSMRIARFEIIAGCLSFLIGLPSASGQCELQKLTLSEPSVDSRFGIAVSVFADRAIVGTLPTTGDLGATYVFRRDDNGTPSDPSDDAWVEEAKLAAWDSAEYQSYGWSVAIAGDRVIIGARFGDAAGVAVSGAGYVFRRDDNGTPSNPTDDFWVEEQKLTASDAAAGDAFGFSVSMSGDRAIVGAREDDHASINSGSAYVFRRSNNDTPSDPTDDFWVEEAKKVFKKSLGGRYRGTWNGSPTRLT